LTKTCTVHGLTDGTSYTFKVIAINAKGKSTASLASNAITPAASVMSRLVGQWLGPPVPPQSSSCGSGYSQWQFTANGQFSAMMATSNCGGYDVSGTYSIVNGKTLWEKITNTGTSYPPPAPYAVGTVKFVNANAFKISEGTNSYTFNRQ
jgi:hypothetical protein